MGAKQTNLTNKEKYLKNLRFNWSTLRTLSFFVFLLSLNLYNVKSQIDLAEIILIMKIITILVKILYQNYHY